MRLLGFRGRLIVEIRFTCSGCGTSASHKLSEIEDKRGYVRLGGNLFLMIPTWVKRDDFGNPVKGRTACPKCCRPVDFQVPRGVCV